MSYLCTYIIFFSAIPPQFCHASCLCQCEVSDGTFFPLWNGKWNCCNCKDYCWKLHVTFCVPFWMILNLFDECILPILRVIKSTLNGGLRLTFRNSRKKGATNGNDMYVQNYSNIMSQSLGVILWPNPYFCFGGMGSSTSHLGNCRKNSQDSTSAASLAAAGCHLLQCSHQRLRKGVWLAKGLTILSGGDGAKQIFREHAETSDHGKKTKKKEIRK